MGSRAVLIIENDAHALAQMRRVLGCMKLSATAACDGDTLREALAQLRAQQTPAILLIARVGLPAGADIRLLEDAAAIFPEASQLVVSHYAKNLLFSVPGFLDHSDHFLQEEFTDEQFQRAVAQALELTTRVW
jgi:CheY-like chemotaxis protein